jgi:hypothetical protein
VGAAGEQGADQDSGAEVQALEDLGVADSGRAAVLLAVDQVPAQAVPEAAAVDGVVAAVAVLFH